VSLTEAAVNHRIEEWRLIAEEAKAHPELQRRGEGRNRWQNTAIGSVQFIPYTSTIISMVTVRII
jgi:hypothetical protein